MSNKCVICGEKIEEDFGKLKGTLLKVKDENNRNQMIYICSDCQKQEGWIEKAKVKGV